MVIATFAGGLFMTFVHTVAKKMPTSEYSVFVALLRVLVILGIPAAALQTVFAQQAAAASEENANRDLVATSRAILKGTFVLWLAIALLMVGFSKSLCGLLKISNPMGLWFTVALGLTTLWAPIFKGLLQGRHHFAGLGWLQIIDGVGRFAAMIVLIVILHFHSAGGMFAALLGQIATVITGAWLTREFWLHKSNGNYVAKRWLKLVLPLTLGTGTVIVMSSLDMLFVQSLFPDENLTGLYGGAMLTGFAIVQFIAPITSVMFSKIARSAARKEESNTLKLTLILTGIFGAMAAIGCTILPTLPLKVIYSQTPEMWAAAPLVPWFGWALLPVTLANVLVQNLLARGRFNAVPWLVLIPVIYATTLALMAPRWLEMPNAFDGFKGVIATLGIFSAILCVVAGIFTARKT